MKLGERTLFAAMAGFACLGPGTARAQTLYTQIGTDPTWSQILAEKAIPLGVNSNAGILGSEIKVDHGLVEIGPYANRRIEQEISIHTVGNSQIPREEFPRWSRWYQEDGNTQVMRLHKGEHNVRNTRPLAARIEAFSKVNWGRGAWHEWSGRYTIVKPVSGAIFQVFNPANQWAMHLGCNSNGDISFSPRSGGGGRTIARNMTGKGFDIRIRDNGHDFEVYLDGDKVGSGTYSRPAERTHFRWGMYVGATEVRGDAMLFVTGAKVDGGNTSPILSLESRPAARMPTLSPVSFLPGMGMVAWSPEAPGLGYTLRGTRVRREQGRQEAPQAGIGREPGL